MCSFVTTQLHTLDCKKKKKKERKKRKCVCKHQIWTAPSPVCTHVCKIPMDFNTGLCSCCNQRASFSVTLIKLGAGSQMTQIGSVINIMHPLKRTQGGKLAAAALRPSHEPQQTDVEWQWHSRDPDRGGGQNMAGGQCSSHLLEPVKEKTAE